MFASVKRGVSLSAGNYPSLVAQKSRKNTQLVFGAGKSKKNIAITSSPFFRGCFKHLHFGASLGFPPWDLWEDGLHLGAAHAPGLRENSAKALREASGMYKLCC